MQSTCGKSWGNVPSATVGRHEAAPEPSRSGSIVRATQRQSICSGRDIRAEHTGRGKTLAVTIVVMVTWGRSGEQVIAVRTPATAGAMRSRSYYASSHWRHRARQVKERDAYQCQICGDRKGDPYCQLHSHHIVPRSKGGSDDLENLITICDLCHAVVTRWWYGMWFRTATTQQQTEVENSRAEFESFLALPDDERRVAQLALWSFFGVQRAEAA